MGMIPPKQQKSTPGSNKRRSTQLDFGILKPLETVGTVGFSSFRDSQPASKKSKSRKPSNGNAIPGVTYEDSDDDEEETEVVGKMEDIEDKDVKSLLSPEDARFSGELADGVGRIKVGSDFSVGPG